MDRVNPANPKIQIQTECRGDFGRGGMTNSCTETTLGEVIELYDHERIPLSTQQRSQRQGESPYYGASGIIDSIDDYIFDGKFLLISEDCANLVERKTPIAFFASGKFWVNNHAHVVRGIPGIADDYFLRNYNAD